MLFWGCKCYYWDETHLRVKTQQVLSHIYCTYSIPSNHINCIWKKKKWLLTLQLYVRCKLNENCGRNLWLNLKSTGTLTGSNYRIDPYFVFDYWWWWFQFNVYTLSTPVCSERSASHQQLSLSFQTRSVKQSFALARKWKQTGEHFLPEIS